MLWHTSSGTIVTVTPGGEDAEERRLPRSMQSGEHESVDYSYIRTYYLEWRCAFVLGLAPCGSGAISCSVRPCADVEWQSLSGRGV